MHDLRRGEEVDLDRGPLAVPRPAAPLGGAPPLRARGGGWEIVPAGATEGRAWIAGGVVELAHLAGQVVALPGDRGILRFGTTTLYFEVFVPPRRPPIAIIDRAWVAAVAFALMVVGGGLTLLRSVSPQSRATLPAALLKPDEVSRLYRGTPLTMASSTSSATRSTAPAPRLRAGDDEMPSWWANGEDEGAVARALAAASAGPSPAPPRDVLHVLLARQAELERCGGPSAPGVAVTLRFVVATSGRVETVSVIDARPPSPAVEKCLTREIARLSFPARTRATTLVHTIRIGES
jgi:hypothetical protein